MRNFKPHTLSEAEEKIVNIKNTTGASALNTLYAAITNRYVFRLEVGGEVKELTRGEIMAYVRESDPDLRKAAYQEQYRVYGQDGPVLGQIYQTLVQDWRNEQVDLRRYSSPIAARNLANDIPDPVVDTLLEVCQRNAALYQRYFRLKARLLGMPRLRRYDIYAPVAKSDKTLSFDRAVELVLDSFSRFDPSLARLAQRVFADNHLDSEVRKGKRSGAFCATVSPDLTPWVLLNYQGRPMTRRLWRTSLGTPSIRCWQKSIAFLPSKPACPWLRPLPHSVRCCLSTTCWRRITTHLCAAICSSARWTTPMPPSCARPSSPCSNARRIK